MKVDILLVEDNHDDAALAMRILKQEHPTVSVVLLRDGAEALNYFFNSSGTLNPKKLPKVIFLDIKLPKLTGPEVLKRLKAHSVTRHVPVVIMTSSNQHRDVTECYELGVNSYLVKPIDFQSYQSMISTCSRYWLNYNVFMTA
ncbi:MAG TPA: response regulator [Geobacteraceae bacterium]|nr:response regulator [Geobacteraceae bacterium]